LALGVRPRNFKLTHYRRPLVSGGPPGEPAGGAQGDQKGRYSIRINDQYRVTFRFERGDAHEVRVEDYHR
jgi:hypothetical protein